jgi:predicted oxidoreductase
MRVINFYEFQQFVALVDAELPIQMSRVGLYKDAQVLDVDGEVIPRLYAAGNTAGIGAPGMVYGGPGGTIGPGLVFNVLAGIHAASLESWA